MEDLILRLALLGKNTNVCKGVSTSAALQPPILRQEEGQPGNAINISTGAAADTTQSTLSIVRQTSLSK